MKKARLLLIVLIISLISGCSKPIPVEPIIKIKTVYVYNVCPKPDIPNYVELDSESHLGSAYNINILIGNALKMKSYNSSLLSSINCYEKQTKEYNNGQN